MKHWLLFSLLTALAVNEDIATTQLNKALTEAAFTVLSDDLPKEDRTREPASESLKEDLVDSNKESISND